MNDSPEYLKGKVEGLERISNALFAVVCRDLSTLSDVVDVRVRIASIVTDIVGEVDAHPDFTNTPFGQGARDALTEFSAKLLN